MLGTAWVDLGAMGISGVLGTWSGARGEWLGFLVWTGVALLIADKVTGVL